MSSLSARSFIKEKIPSLPFRKIAESILPGWEISLVFAGPAKAKRVNMELRGKDYVPNVLSYESGKKSGEIIICPSVAKEQAPDYDMTYRKFLAFLFIHGCLHLKGQQHGPTMERRERALLAKLIR
jgi:probable rRNA maturation factor